MPLQIKPRARDKTHTRLLASGGGTVQAVITTPFGRLARIVSMAHKSWALANYFTLSLMGFVL
jgi:hypothetical protein